MQNRLLIAGAISTVALILFLAAGAIPVHGGDPTIIFQTPAFLAAAAAGAFLLLAACFLRRPPLRRMAFALTHAGLAPGDVTGLSWRPGRGFVMSPDTMINYFITATH